MRGILLSKTRALLACLLALGWSAGTAQLAKADVRDGAGIFKPATVSKANEIISRIQEKHHKNMVVETFASAPAGSEQKAKSKDEKERNEFFRDWAIRRAESVGVNGIYVLISKSPGHVQVVVGNETAKHDFTNADRDHLSSLFLKE